MKVRLTERDKADLALLSKAIEVAKILGCNYRVNGVGPGAMFVSDAHPYSPIELPEVVIDHLLLRETR